MKSVLIFAKTPYELTPYDKWLESTGVKPIILTTNEYADGYSRSIENVIGFSNFEADEQILRVAEQILLEQSVVAIFARAESDILRTARLRSQFQIEGQTLESAQAFRDKFEMKSRLLNVVRTPAFRKVENYQDAVEFAHEWDFPVVVKPLSESGSTGVQIYRSPAELATLEHELSPQAPRLIESFVDGMMYHVDGLVQDGEIVFAQPSRYVNDCLAFRDNKPLGSVLVSPEHPDFIKLVRSTREVLATLPTPRNTAFHAEFWVTPSGDVIFCEIASRTGGAMIASLFRSRLGVDLDREWLRSAVGRTDRISYKYQAGGWIIFQPKQGRLLALPNSVPSLVTETRTTGAVGRIYGGGVKSGLFLSGYAIQAQDEQSVGQHLDELSRWFELETSWGPL